LYYNASQRTPNTTDVKPVVSSGSTGLILAFSWIYLIASIIAGIVLIGQCAASYGEAYGYGHDDKTYLAGIGLGVMFQGVVVFSFLSVIVHLGKNIAKIRELLESRK